MFKTMQLKKKINLLATKNILNKWETQVYFLIGKGCFALGRMEKNLIWLFSKTRLYLDLPEKQTITWINIWEEKLGLF